MKGPPDTPTIHLEVRLPEQALPKIWNICDNQGYGCAAHQTRHLEAGLSLCLVPQVPEEDSGGQAGNVR
jgi:hypothetical protein